MQKHLLQLKQSFVRSSMNIQTQSSPVTNKSNSPPVCHSSPAALQTNANSSVPDLTSPQVQVTPKQNPFRNTTSTPQQKDSETKSAEGVQLPKTQDNSSGSEQLPKPKEDKKDGALLESLLESFILLSLFEMDILESARRNMSAEIPLLMEQCKTLEALGTPIIGPNALKIEKYLAAAAKWGSSDLSAQHFYGDVWKEFESKSFIASVCQCVSQAWPKQHIGGQEQIANLLISKIFEKINK